MKRDESPELASARRLLSELEKEIALPGALAKLSEALALLAEAAEGDDPEPQIARNLMGVYAAKVVSRANAVLEMPGEAAPAELHHFRDLLEEFQASGMESEEIAATLSRIGKRLATRHVSKLTHGEKEVLLKQLEAEVERERAKKKAP